MECTGLYKYKGFTIFYSNYYKFWSIEASYLLNENIKGIEDFVSEITYGEFKTISSAKKYIKDNEKDLKKWFETELGKY